MPNANFVECSITNTPFEDEQFDLIFSNHVIEHIDDVPQAFAELRRIGRPSCIYAFSVPTNIWLLLSIPASYYEKVKKAVGVPSRYGSDGNWVDEPVKAAPREPMARRRKLLHRLLPAGHGITSDFGACYRQFQIKNWESFFRSQGLSVSAIKPLLLYGPCQLPVIPTMKSVGKVCSSVLFLMEKTRTH
jgi:SAM-dependent methyltransferase